MKKHQLLTFALATTLVSGISNYAYSDSNNAGNIQFACGQNYDQAQNQYFFTTFTWSPETKKPLIVWKREFWTAQGLDPQTRCQEVSPRFQKAQDNGTLKFMRNGTLNNQPVICTVQEIGDDCDTGTLLLTLLPKDDAEKTLEQLSDILLGDADSALVQSSGDIVYQDGDTTYVEIDIENFLSQE